VLVGGDHGEDGGAWVVESGGGPVLAGPSDWVVSAGEVDEGEASGTQVGVESGYARREEAPLRRGGVGAAETVGACDGDDGKAPPRHGEELAGRVGAEIGGDGEACDACGDAPAMGAWGDDTWRREGAR